MKVKRIRSEVPLGGNSPVLSEEHFDVEPHEVQPGDVVVEAHPVPEEIPGEEVEQEEEVGTDEEEEDAGSD